MGKRSQEDVIAVTPQKRLLTAARAAGWRLLFGPRPRPVQGQFLETAMIWSGLPALDLSRGSGSGTIALWK
jgi:hypothetical protein